MLDNLICYFCKRPLGKNRRLWTKVAGRPYKYEDGKQRRAHINCLEQHQYDRQLEREAEKRNIKITEAHHLRLREQFG